MFLLDGSLEHYNARWVLPGFSKWPKIDYDESFSSCGLQFGSLPILVHSPTQCQDHIPTWHSNEGTILHLTI
jgi:hypothetical protein